MLEETLTKMDEHHIAEIVESIEKILAELKHIKASTSASIEEVVKEHPGRSLAIALGLGFLIGRIL